MIGLESYVANTSFLSKLKWRTVQGAYNTSEIVDIEDQSPAHLIIIGVVSDDAQTHLSPHGDYKANTNFPIEFKKAKLRFTLSPPNDPILAADFATGLQSLKHLQELGANSTGTDKQHFIARNGDLKFSFPLWEKNVSSWPSSSSIALSDHLTCV